MVAGAMIACGIVSHRALGSAPIYVLQAGVKASSTHTSAVGRGRYVLIQKVS